MSPKHTESNISSWQEVSEFVDSFPDENYKAWKERARRILRHGTDRNWNHHFRAGTSMWTLMFSTLDHHGLTDEPRVMLRIGKSGDFKVTYIPALPAPKKDEKLEYELKEEEALPTLQRMLNHLWEMTMAEPLPRDMRAPDHPFSAPIL